MKKLLLVLLALALTIPAALADITIVDGFADYPAEAAMTEYLAAQLAGQMQEKIAVVHEENGSEAVNAFLKLPAQEAVLVSNQEAMIRSLTQYDTDEDMREALLPVTCVAASGAALYASQEAVQMLPDISPETLTAYTEENPYELSIARMVDVDANDYLTLEATQDLYVDQNTYVDYDEAVQAAEDGACDLIAFSDGMRPLAAESYVRLFPIDLPGVWQGVFVNKEGAQPLADRLAAALPAVCAGEEWLSLMDEAGYTSAPCLDQPAFEAEVTALFADYVRYLTNEGLFFYEQ